MASLEQPQRATVDGFRLPQHGLVGTQLRATVVTGG